MASIFSSTVSWILMAIPWGPHPHFPLEDEELGD